MTIVHISVQKFLWGRDFIFLVHVELGVELQGHVVYHWGHCWAVFLTAAQCYIPPVM